MTPSKARHFSQIGRRQSAWILVCFCVLGLAPVALGETQDPCAVELSSSQSASAALPQDSRPVIYIFRPPKFKFMGLTPDVHCDGVPVSEIFTGTYLTVRVSPGKHIITAAGSRIKNQGSVELDAVGGGSYYVEVSVVGFSKATAALVSKETGESEISKRCKPIGPFLLEAPKSRAQIKAERAQIKAENETLKASAAKPPAPSVASPTASAAGPAVSSAQGGLIGHETVSAASPPPPVGTPSRAVAPLTDAQIQAAIQRGVDDRDRGGSLGIHGRAVTINGDIHPVAQRIFVFSDSDRIAVAADVASHDVTKVDYLGAAKRQPKAAFSFSVEDAKATAAVFGVVTLIVEFSAGKEASVAKWYGPSYRITLNADGKIIEPVTNTWNYENYFKLRGCEGESLRAGLNPRGLLQPNGPYMISCSYMQVTFPVIEGAHKLTVITDSASGHHKEKEVDPKLFEER